jgi:hypothetical protein
VFPQWFSASSLLSTRGHTMVRVPPPCGCGMVRIDGSNSRPGYQNDAKPIHATWHGEKQIQIVDLKTSSGSGIETVFAFVRHMTSNYDKLLVFKYFLGAQLAQGQGLYRTRGVPAPCRSEVASAPPLQCRDGTSQRCKTDSCYPAL